MKTCIIKECNNNVFSGGKCKFHQSRQRLKTNKPLHVTRGSTSDVSLEKREYSRIMMEFFRIIWNKRAHVSEVSGEKLMSSLSSLYFHHILPKSKTYNASFDESNIIILSPEEHMNVELNKFRYEEINKRREMLLKKYNIFD